MGARYYLREGHPPDDELLIRLTVSRTFKPELSGYVAVPDEGIEQAKDVLDAMLYDMRQVEHDQTCDYHEILFPPIDDDGFLARTNGIWEVVDKHGTIWSVKEDD